jgi:hypothetical protein
MDVSPAFVAHHQPAVAGYPRKSPLHYPPPAPQPLAALYPAPGDPHLYAASAKEPSAARVVVPFICMELVGSLARPASLTLHGRDRVNELLKNCRVMHVSRGQDRGEMYAVRISDDVTTWRLEPALPRSSGLGPIFSPPLFAGMLAESRLTLDQSILSALPNRSIRTRCNRSNTPAFRQSRRRRQQVAPLHPNALGSSPHGMPIFSTYTISEKTARGAREAYHPSALAVRVARVAPRRSTARRRRVHRWCSIALLSVHYQNPDAADEDQQCAE